MMRSKLLRLALVAAFGAGVVASAGPAMAEEITMATWGGKFGKLFQVKQANLSF